MKNTTPPFVLTAFLLSLQVAAIASSTFGQRAENLPAYALTYAPWSYLYSGDKTFPSDITVHLNHTVPEVDYTSIGDAGSVTVNTLSTYASNVYLTSADNVLEEPAWLLSDYGVPDSSGYSAAPGLIIAAEKNASTTDVFYFYFYSYNIGRPVLGIEFDLHIGDWEHVMVKHSNLASYTNSAMFSLTGPRCDQNRSDSSMGSPTLSIFPNTVRAQRITGMWSTS